MYPRPTPSIMDCHVRLAAPEDAAAVHDIYSPFVETTAISFEVEPPSVEETRERIETTLREYPWLVYEADGGVIGYAAAGSLRSTPPYRWTVELSVYVAGNARRSGVGTALYTSLLEVLERQGYYSAYAVTTLPNPASTRLHENMGFEPVGTFPAVGYKHGEWHDVRWWYRQVAERPSDPNPPTPLPDLRGTAELDAALAAGEERLDDRR